MKKILIILIFLPNLIFAQNLSNLKKINKNDSINFSDSINIIQNSIKKDSSKLLYRTYNHNFNKRYFHKYFDSLSLKNNTQNRYVYKPNSSKSNDFFSDSEINKSGSISRGLSVGNNQDVAVSSNLNLQLSGKISKKVSILAVISDDNIPIQTEGQTQNLREFDKVFIKLFSDNHSLTVGDFNTVSPKGYFLKSNKKVQGLQISSKTKFKNYDFTTTTSGAVSKGNYNRIKLQGQEGNQGPYKLSGKNNESFITILSGSEKVFIDGSKLTRGLDNDYVIDYNLGEISFTAKQIITSNSRIIIEFEYSDRNYVRFTSLSENIIKNKQNTFYLNFFTDSDIKTQTLQQELSDYDKELLNSLGDSINNAIIVNANRIDSLSENEVLYRKTDTLINNVNFDDIFVYSSNNNDEKYRVGFSYMGENQGNYIRSKSNINGKIYEWVKPENNIPQGNYEPIRKLVSPKTKNIVVFGGENFIKEKTKISYELAYSKNDINTFSQKDKGNDNSFATKISIKRNLINSKNKKSLLSIDGNYFHIHKNFDAVENYKSTEFLRNWNILNENKNISENLFNLNLNFNKNNKITAKYMFDFLNKADNFSGIKNSATAKTHFKNTKIKFDISYLLSEDKFSSTNFLKYKSNIEQDTKIATFGTGLNGEKNKWKNLQTDSILQNSNIFNEYFAYIKTPTNFKIQVSTTYKHRTDFLPINNEITKHSISDDISVNTNFLNSKNFKLKSTISYREFTPQDTIIQDDKLEKNLIGQISGSLNFWKASISSSAFIQHASGLEMKNDYTYIETQSGQGVFAWKDFNKNNIKELNEFVIANFSDEANYLRIILPSNVYEKVYNQSFNYSLSLNPKRIWHSQKGLKKFATYFSDKINFQINRKIAENELFYRLIINDSSILSMNSVISNKFSFKTKSRKINFDLITNKSSNKILEINSSNLKIINYNKLIYKHYMGKFIVKNSFKKGQKTYNSDIFSDNNYNIYFIENQLSATYNYSTNFSFSLISKISEKNNKSSSEIAKIYDFGTELKYGIPLKSNIIAKANFVNIAFKGNENTSISYEMLEGLHSGKNYILSLAWSKSISKTLMLEISYLGRKSETDKFIHSGNIQIRAVF